MDKMIKEKQFKELKSRKTWEKIINAFLFIIQTFTLSIGLNIVIEFFIKNLELEIKTTWFACWMLVTIFQTIYMVTKRYTEAVKEIDDKYKNLIDKIK